MSRKCQVTGRKGRVGNNVSHSNRRTKRKHELNLQFKKFYIPSKKKWVRLRVTTKLIKTISKLGIEKVLRQNAVKV